jgi:hypothetical protein
MIAESAAFTHQTGFNNTCTSAKLLKPTFSQNDFMKGLQSQRCPIPRQSYLVLRLKQHCLCAKFERVAQWKGGG